MWPGSAQNKRAGNAVGRQRSHGAADAAVVDTDVDLHDPQQRRETRPRQWDLLLAVALVVLCLLDVLAATTGTQVLGRVVLKSGVRRRSPGRSR